MSGPVSAASRVIYHRNITDRVTTIAPFLRFDADPYLVIADGRLYWMRDAYTTTDHYPYSTPFAPGVNYIRNSVKVVIDAYNGTTTFYLAEPDDPLGITLGKILPRPVATARDDARDAQGTRAVSGRHLLAANSGVPEPFI